MTLCFKSGLSVCVCVVWMSCGVVVCVRPVGWLVVGVFGVCVFVCVYGCVVVCEFAWLHGWLCACCVCVPPFGCVRVSLACLCLCDW